MQNKINSILYTTGFLLFLVCFPIYLLGQNFSIERFIDFWESILEYKYRVFFVIIVYLLICVLEAIPSKKHTKFKLFFLRWKPIVTIIMFIYPFLPDFQQRFWKISESNVTDFYAIFLPIFIVFFINSIRGIWDPEFLKEMKNDLSIKSKRDDKVNSLIKRFFVFLILSGYCFLFAILTLRISLINKVNLWYKNEFPRFFFLFFIFSLGISLFLYAILKSNTNKESDTSDLQKLKADKKDKKNYENIKVKFK